MNLQEWLLEKNIKSIDFCKSVGCSRVTLCKVKRGVPVSPRFAKRIEELTEGKICPPSENVGRKSFKDL